jgi:hypothetical protein
MSTQIVSELVASRIAGDKEMAQATARRVLATNVPLTDESIRDFFPELGRLPDRRRSNLPRDVPLPHQLLLGPPTIFDLEPLAERAFEERYRITVRVAEELTELGRIIPNLYVRKPDAWHGMSHLKGLVGKSLVNGERVDAYFQARDTRYHDLKQSRKRVSSYEHLFLSFTLPADSAQN